VKNLNLDETEETLKSKFEFFGEIISTLLMKTEDGKSKGFGFVCFKDSENAMKAQSELNGKDGLYVVKALKKEERLSELKKLTEKYKSSLKKFNLYVRGYPLDTSDEEASEYFS
jgi:polyadenylate-binding protein